MSDALSMLVRTCLERRPCPEHTWRLHTPPLTSSPWANLLARHRPLQEHIAHVLLACLHNDPNTPPPTDPECLLVDLMSWLDNPPFVVAPRYVFREVGRPRITLATAHVTGSEVLEPLDLLAIPPALSPEVAIERASRAFEVPLVIPVSLSC